MLMANNYAISQTFDLLVLKNSTEVTRKIIESHVLE